MIAQDVVLASVFNTVSNTVFIPLATVVFTFFCIISFSFHEIIKQAELAETLEISNNHMSSIENGRQKPSLDTFIRLCDCLNVTPDYLLLGSMHAYNLPQDILDKLRLCSQEDIILARDFIELLVKRNRKKHITDSPISF